MLSHAALRQELRAATRGRVAVVSALHRLPLRLCASFAVASDLVVRQPLAVAEPLLAASDVALDGLVAALPLLSLLQELLRRLWAGSLWDLFLVVGCLSFLLFAGMF